ncbi:MAG: hypothetical protein ACM3N7_05660 [Planctomycetaceae bacterium]
MKRKIVLDFRTLLFLAGLILGVFVAGSFWLREPPQAFGGGFSPIAQQPFARYQIASRDANSAWVIDTSAGDVFLIFTSGKWKDVGSLFEEKNRIKN